MTAFDRSSRDAAAIASLARGETQAAAAAASGLSERTIRRRLADPGFRQAVAEARREAVQRALGVLAAGATGAAATLVRLLRHESAWVQLSAARAVLHAATQGVELEALQARLAALEARTEEETYDEGVA